MILLTSCSMSVGVGSDPEPEIDNEEFSQCRVIHRHSLLQRVYVCNFDEADCYVYRGYKEGSMQCKWK